MICRMSGALSIDESIALAQGVCSGNPGTALFALLPQPHSSCNFSTVLKHRRLVEDKVVSKLSSSGALYIYIYSFLFISALNDRSIILA